MSNSAIAPSSSILLERSMDICWSASAASATLRLSLAPTTSQYADSAFWTNVMIESRLFSTVLRRLMRAVVILNRTMSRLRPLSSCCVTPKLMPAPRFGFSLTFVAFETFLDKLKPALMLCPVESV